MISVQEIIAAAQREGSRSASGAASARRDAINAMNQVRDKEKVTPQDVDSSKFDSEVERAKGFMQKPQQAPSAQLLPRMQKQFQQPDPMEVTGLLQSLGPEAQGYATTMYSLMRDQA